MKEKPLFKIKYLKSHQCFDFKFHFATACPGDQDVSFGLGPYETNQLLLAILKEFKKSGWKPGKDLFRGKP